jgi:ParB-like chromosome segregation protein Spo0J
MKQHKQMMMKVSDLKNLKNNARKHSKEQIEQIKASLQRFGFLSPIVVDSNGTVVAGNGRIVAAKELGVKEVPAILAEGLSGEELRAYALVDNKLSDNSSFDIEILKAELEDLTMSLDFDFDMGTVGFSEKEMQALLKEDTFVPSLPEGDEALKPISHKLIIECRDADEKQELFDELNDRGYKLKGG